MGEYTSTGALIREYVYFNGRPLAQIDEGTNEEITYFHVDHLGTPRVGTDDTGASVWSWSFLGNAFGDIAPSSSSTVTVNLRMAGQYYDDESGLFYNWNRYYDPATGRYVSSDPIGLAGGLNTFTYAGANPALYIDPEGLRTMVAGGMQDLGEGVGEKIATKMGTRSIPIIGQCLRVLDFGIIIGACAGDFENCGAIAAEVLTGAPVYTNAADGSTDGVNTPPKPKPGEKADEDATGEEGGKTPEDLLDESENIDDKGRVTNGEKGGGQGSADQDFDDIVDPESVVPTNNGGRTGKTKDGRRVNVYPDATSTGTPTVEIINGDGTRIKIRYF